MVPSPFERPRRQRIMMINDLGFQHPVWMFAAAIPLSLLFGYLARKAIGFAAYGIPQILYDYPLYVIEGENSDHRASWLSKGVLLSSRSTGKEIAEIPATVVRTALKERGGLASWICLRFNGCLKVAV